jgi:hypothetical protein
MPRKSSVALPQPVFDEPTFNESVNSPLQTQFSTPHPSDSQQYKALTKLLTTETTSFSAMRGNPDDLFTLTSALGPHGPERAAAIQQAGQIVFHSAGDTGASNAGKYGNEVRVADQVTADCNLKNPALRPAFFYHLGDTVYDFGESTYYFDQFYEPFRNYPGPIVAIPGNHDSFVVPGTAANETPLSIFARNFCATSPTVTKEAGSMHRTAMTQPGVYFTFDAPFVRIIGLFSNALEDPGVISSQKNQTRKWPGVPDVQLAYLGAQLKRIKTENYAGAVLLAVHHPPFAYSTPPAKPGAGGDHSSSPDMLREIDTICQAQGVYPHAVLSGHSHNYQRYTRTVTLAGKTYTVPFVVCGDGGHNVNALVQGRKGVPPTQPAKNAKVDYLEVSPAVKVGGLVLNNYDGSNYGYLRITVTPKQLTIGFYPVGSAKSGKVVPDVVIVDLASHTIKKK